MCANVLYANFGTIKSLKIQSITKPIVNRKKLIIMISRFEIRRENSNYYFVLFSSYNDILVTSKKYKSKTDCWHGAQATKKCAQTSPIIAQTR